jgi:hypothetical protein
MTRKIYTSAQGKTVDLGSLLLQNENVRAVGNMNVNARGDLVDGNNQVIEKKTHLVQRHYKKQSNVTDESVVSTSTVSAKKSQAVEPDNLEIAQETFVTEVEEPVLEELASIQPKIPAGGLAAAIARSKTLKQELEKTPRQLAQEKQGIKKI